jgi:hypothetical protein
MLEPAASSPAASTPVAAIAAISLASLLEWLEQLNDIGASLSKERDINRLLEKILLAAKTITYADGGALYRMLDDGKTLRFEILRTDFLGIAMEGTAGVGMNFPDLPPYNSGGHANDTLVAAYAALHRVPVNIDDAYTDQIFIFLAPAPLTSAPATAPSRF